MIQRLDRHEITEESIRQVLTESIEADNPDSEQADAADLVAKAEAAVPLYIVPLYNLDDPVQGPRLPSCSLYFSSNCVRAPKDASGCCGYYCNGGVGECRRRWRIVEIIFTSILAVSYKLHMGK